MKAHSFNKKKQSLFPDQEEVAKELIANNSEILNEKVNRDDLPIHYAAKNSAWHENSFFLEKNRKILQSNRAF